VDPAPNAPIASPKRRAKFLVGGLIVTCALFGLIAWAMFRPEATTFYLNVSEVKAQGVTPPAEAYRVNGKVVPGSVDRSGLSTSFAITDGGQRLRVRTDQALPDAFWAAVKADSSEIDVVAQGRYDGRTFAASQVLAKCPSKFKARA
jgi:cytochrome c-type biogenesis protein CcmE